jgi:phosphate transport system substrate-binding protein
LLATPVPDNFRVFAPDPAGDQSYPIVTYTWILAHKHYDDAEKGKAVKAFLEWCLTNGQKECETLGFVRLPTPLAERVLREVRKIE